MRYLKDCVKITCIMANFSPSFKVNFVQLNQLIAGFLAIVFVSVAILATIGIEKFYRDKYLPKTLINNVEISNLTRDEALIKVTQSTIKPEVAVLVQADNQVATISAEQTQAAFDYNGALQSLSEQSAQLPWHQRYFRALGFGNETNQNAILHCNKEAIASAAATLATKTHRSNQEPAINLEASGSKQSIKIEPGKIGYEIDQPATTKLIEQQCATLTSEMSGTPIQLDILAVVIAPPTPLNEQEIATIRQRAEKLVGKQLNLTIQNQVFHIIDKQLVSFLSPNNGWRSNKITESVDAISKQLLTEPSNAVFEFDPQTLKVSQFTPPRDGLTIATDETRQQIESSLQKWQDDSAFTESQQELVVKITAKSPDITLEKTNGLGINSLIGFGNSAYAHSIPTRVHNVALTAKKINLAIIKPGEEFSFNKTLGEVSKATGFQPAYVIKSGRTELGDGGGVCQVSSTLFRAAMNAGLNITKRLPHSYRVSYYELNSKAGFDATVYSGNVDFRFINDTPGHILIYTETDSKNLTMKIELYGSSDGRVSTISDYKSWGASRAPASVYIDDPSLPPGRTKQIDWATGGLKTSFIYTVKDKTGTVKQQETYYSNYLPWSAKYLRGPSI